MLAVRERETDEPVSYEFVDTIAEASKKASDRNATIPSAYVYVIEAEGLGLFKIGRAVCAVSRLGSYKTACPVPTTPIMIVRVSSRDADYVERYLHNHFSKVRHRGEWFRLRPEHLGQIRSLVAEAAAKGLKAIDRELSRLPVIYDPEAAAQERAMAAHLKAVTARNSVPTGELIVDRIAYLYETQSEVRIGDLTRSIDRRPRIIHQAMRSLLLDGKVAMRSPRRHPKFGTVRLDAYKYSVLVLPDASCEWENVGFGEEVLISEPPGHFVPEVFGRTE